MVFLEFCAFQTNCVAQSTHNVKKAVLIDRTTLLQEFLKHHTIAIEKNSEQNLHFWPNFTCFFRSWLLWTLPLGWLGFGFIVIVIHPWFVTNYDLFEQIWIVIERLQYFLNDVHVTLFLLKILQFCSNLRCRMFHA